MTTRIEIIEAARECLDTPFRHQGRVKGKALDCVGLVRYAAVRTGLTEEDYTNYGKAPEPKRMREILLQYFDEVTAAEMQPGDILWIRVANDPSHLAILTYDNTIVHAFNRSNPKKQVFSKVVEHAFVPPWSNRITSVFRYRGLQ